MDPQMNLVPKQPEKRPTVVTWGNMRQAENQLLD
jgi:hypothetical protein